MNHRSALKGIPTIQVSGRTLYLGLAYLQTGQTELAKAQLAEIMARGGAGSWSQRVLAQALIDGDATRYDY